MGRPNQTRMKTELLRLTIEDVGLIARAEVTFGAGFTAFTGETGSGKTMLLGALDAALGGRVERDMVRGERARVTLELVPGEAVRAYLLEAGIGLAPDDDVAIVREIGANGRSHARVNGVAVSATQLRELAARTVDAIGQGEAARLLDPGFARDVLNRLAGPDALAVAARLREAYARRERLRAERDELGAGTERAAAERDFARFARDEIDAAKLDDGEDERLRERRDVLGNAERIAEALAHARAALEDERGAVDVLGDAVHALAGLARFGEPFATLAAAAAALQTDANALAADVARAADDVERDPSELAAVVERLDLIDGLKKKYGGTLAEVQAARDRFDAIVQAGAGRGDRVRALEREIADAEQTIRTDADALHAHRVVAAARCDERVQGELHALAMPAARFSVALEPLAAVAAHGRDRVEFRFSANPGEPERPLAKIASGGEKSRVLLALVVVLADARDERAFVFDEIDAGIGGATAVAVGGRLARLALVTQVISVTHLAQIAAQAGTHYSLRKHEEDGVTTIDVVALADDDSRRSEIARMLSGENSPVSLEHAARLLAGAAAADLRQTVDL